MKIAKLVRYRVDDGDTPFVFGEYENGNLNFNDNQHIQLMGPQFAHIANGRVLNNIRGNYPEADYHLCLEVMVEINWRKRSYRWERWYVTFATN